MQIMGELLDANLLFDVCPVGLILLDSAGTIARVNDEIERMFGYRRTELVGSCTERLVPGAVQKRHAAQRRLYFAQPERRTVGQGAELQAVRRDGTEFLVEVAMTPLSTAHGVCALAAVTDISERKALEEEHTRRHQELERSNLELEQFAAIASHDMREPLRMVVSYTELLAEHFDGKLDARTQKFMSYVTEGAKRMQRLIDDLLAYSRLDVHRQHPVPTRVEDALRDVLQDMRPLIQETGAQITYGDLPTLLVDAVQFERLLANVIHNAIKFRRDEPPRVQIRADAWQGMWRLAVQDNGIGLDKAHSQRIFQMFQRLNERAKYEGSGIGLAVAKKIVERHGGQIWVDSSPGQGATFYFTLPGAARVRAS
jgi:PAS domain S-box-containing protein